MPALNRMRGFNAAVRAAMNPRFVVRGRNINFTITQGATTSLPLLICDDDPDYDQAFDGTTPAECGPGSRIIALQLHLSIFGAPELEPIEWILMKDPDAVITAANQTPANLYTQDVSLTTKVMRKYTMAMGHFIAETNKTNAPIQINVPSRVMRRIGPMQENDVLRLTFTMTAAAANATLYFRGRIIFRQA